VIDQRDVGEGLGHGEIRLTRPDPSPPFICVQCDRGPTTMSWLAPPIRARDRTGVGLSLDLLGARSGQSNILPLGLNLKYQY
jgi:hypothetical protein